MFLFWSFGIWGLTVPGRTAPHPQPRTAIPRNSKHAFHMQTNQSQPPLLGSHTWALSSCPSHPRVRHQTAIAAPMPRARWNSSNQLILNLLSQLTLPHPLLPVKTTIQALAHTSPYSFCLLTSPGASSCGPAWHCGLALLLRISSLFNGSHLLICWGSIPE